MKTLVAYFSAQGTTAKVAKELAAIASADLYEIKPKVKYTLEDLNWQNPQSRSSVEMKNKQLRPEIVQGDLDVAPYDLVLLGFPIWWYVAPTIVNSFLESYDFANKRIVLFATSGGSGFGSAVSELKPSVDASATISEGKVFNRASKEILKTWIDSLGLN